MLQILCMQFRNKTECSVELKSCLFFTQAFQNNTFLSCNFYAVKPICSIMLSASHTDPCRVMTHIYQQINPESHNSIHEDMGAQYPTTLNLRDTEEFLIIKKIICKVLCIVVHMVNGDLRQGQCTEKAVKAVKVYLLKASYSRLRARHNSKDQIHAFPPLVLVLRQYTNRSLRLKASEWCIV